MRDVCAVTRISYFANLEHHTACCLMLAVAPASAGLCVTSEQSSNVMQCPRIHGHLNEICHMHSTLITPEHIHCIRNSCTVHPPLFCIEHSAIISRAGHQSLPYTALAVQNQLPLPTRLAPSSLAPQMQTGAGMGLNHPMHSLPVGSAI